MTAIKTRRKMGWVAIAFHSMMIMFTMGLWTPMFLAARRRRLTVTYMPQGYMGAVGPNGVPQPGYAPQSGYGAPHQQWRP